MCRASYIFKSRPQLTTGTYNVLRTFLRLAHHVPPPPPFLRLAFRPSPGSKHLSHQRHSEPYDLLRERAQAPFPSASRESPRYWPRAGTLLL